MTWLRRIGFFLALNIAVMMTVSLVLSLLGVQPYLTSHGLDIGSLMVFCLVWGMVGAFFSLAISRMVAKWTMGIQLIDPSTRNPNERQVIDTVYRLARAARLTTMPEVGVYESPEVNAFATGPTRSRSLVAVSSGLLNALDSRSVEGVLGHEITHITNGDMVTMTLLQGVVNAFVMALARIVAFAIDNALRDQNNGRGGGLGYFGRMMVIMVLETLFFIPGSMIIAAYSRRREYRADQGGAQLAGRENMVSALKSLLRLQARNEMPEVNQQTQSAPAIAALKISGGRGSRMGQLFATHPPLEERIARLERGF